MTRMIKTTTDESVYYIFLSAAFEKCLFDQTYAYADSILLRPNVILEKTTVLNIQILQLFKNGDLLWIKVVYAKHYLRISETLLIV